MSTVDQPVILDDDRGLARRVGRAGLWLGVGSLVSRVGGILLMAVVARLVSPEQFGVFVVAATVFGFIVSVAELGLSSAIARSDLPLDRIGSTVNTLSVLFAAALASVMFASADPLAAAMGSPAAGGALRVLSLSILLTGLFAVPGARLQREFRQEKLFQATLASFLVSSVLLVALAYRGDGAMAFAWSRVVGQVVGGLWMMRAVGQAAGFGIRAGELRGLLRFGLPVAGANLLSQVLLNIDFLFIGSISGASALGIYALAFNVAGWSGALLASIINGSTVPAFSQVRATGGDLAAAVFHAVRGVALLAAPISLTTLALAHPLVTVLYGDRWAGSADVLQVLAVYGFLFVIGLLFANLLISLARTGLLFVVQVVALMALVPALLLGLHLRGPVGVGIAHAVVASSITIPVYVLAVRHSTGLTWTQLGSALGRPLAAASASAAAAYLTATVIPVAWLQVVAGGAVAVSAYLLLAGRALSAASPWPLPRALRTVMRA